jgi:hypothetical protein
VWNSPQKQQKDPRFLRSPSGRGCGRLASHGARRHVSILDDVSLLSGKTLAWLGSPWDSHQKPCSLDSRLQRLTAPRATTLKEEITFPLLFFFVLLL